MCQANALAAVLAAGHLGDNLGGNVAGGGKAVRLLDKGTADNCAVLQHVLQIDQIAVVHVLRIIIHVVEVDQPLFVSLHNIRGQQQAAADVLTDLAGHIVPLYAVDRGIFIGILLFDFLVVALDKAQDLVVRGVGLAHQIPGIAVTDIALGHLKGAVGHDLGFHQLLDFFHRQRTVHLRAVLLHPFGDLPDLLRRQLPAVFVGIVGLGHRRNDLGEVEYRLRAVSLDNFHTYPSFQRPAFLSGGGLASLPLEG